MQEANSALTESSVSLGLLSHSSNGCEMIVWLSVSQFMDKWYGNICWYCQYIVHYFVLMLRWFIANDSVVCSFFGAITNQPAKPHCAIDSVDCLLPSSQCVLKIYTCASVSLDFICTRVFAVVILVCIFSSLLLQVKVLLCLVCHCL